MTLYGSMFSALVIITENASVPSARSSSQMRNRRYCTSSPGAKWIVCSAECGIAATCSGRIWERIASVRLPLTPLEPSSRVGSPVAASFSIARRLFVELTASLPATDSTEAEATESRSEALASSSSRSASSSNASSSSSSSDGEASSVSSLSSASASSSASDGVASATHSRTSSGLVFPVSPIRFPSASKRYSVPCSARSSLSEISLPLLAISLPLAMTSLSPSVASLPLSQSSTSLSSSTASPLSVSSLPRSATCCRSVFPLSSSVMSSPSS